MAEAHSISFARRFGPQESRHRIDSIIKMLPAMKPGDIVHTASVICIGQRPSKILRSLKDFHDAGVTLHIVDIEYLDNGETDHYRLLTDYLTVMSIPAKSEKPRRERAGNPGITLEDLPRRVFDLIAKYCMDEHAKRKDLLSDIAKTGHFYNPSTVDALVGDYNDLYRIPKGKPVFHNTKSHAQRSRAKKPVM